MDKALNNGAGGVNAADADGQCIITLSSSSSSRHQLSSATSESDYLMIASLQLGALKALSVLLTSAKYTELLLVPRESADDNEKASSRVNADLQVQNSTDLSCHFIVS